MSFESRYQLVRGIVLRLYSQYRIKGWQVEDWEQEGRLVLFELETQMGEGLYTDPAFYRYYKTKYRSHMIDLLRKETSQKRQFNQMGYEEVHELSDCLSASSGLMTEDLYLFRQALSDYRHQLSQQELKQYDLLLSGASFKGRKALLNRLSQVFSDYQDCL